jgi:hypothetical protein
MSSDENNSTAEPYRCGLAARYTDFEVIAAFAHREAGRIGCALRRLGPEVGRATAQSDRFHPDTPARRAFHALPAACVFTVRLSGLAAGAA